MWRFKSMVIVLSLGLLAGTAGAASPRSLQVGDAAPPLKVEHWLKGTPVSTFEPGKLYVVEFSATWCPPCRKAIPHFTKLNHEYAGKVNLISVYASERSDKDDPKDRSYLDKVKYLMSSMGEQMDFPLAVDPPKSSTTKDWKIFGVPTAYVIDGTGHIVWVGEPTELDPVLSAMVAGTFQPTQVAASQKQLSDGTDEVRKLKMEGKPVEALAKINQMIQAHPKVQHLYIVKYGVLNGYDPAQADALLTWILKADMPGFDWDHFVYDTYSAKQPNYDLALATVDHAISKAETKIVKANLMQRKVEIYVKRSQSHPATAKQDVQRANATLEQARQLAQSPEVPQDRTLQNSLQLTQFKIFAGADDAKANALLRTMLQNKQPNIYWSSYVSAALESQKQPDYALLHQIADRMVADASKDGADKGRALCAKGDVYAAAGETSKAQSCYQQAVVAAKAVNDAQSAKLFEEKMAKLRKQST